MIKPSKKALDIVEKKFMSILLESALNTECERILQLYLYKLEQASSKLLLYSKTQSHRFYLGKLNANRI